MTTSMPRFLDSAYKRDDETLPRVKLDYSIFSDPNSPSSGRRYVENNFKRLIWMLVDNWEPFLNDELDSSGFKNPDRIKELIGEESYSTLCESADEMFWGFIDERKPQPSNTMEIIMYESFLKATWEGYPLRPDELVKEVTT